MALTTAISEIMASKGDLKNWVSDKLMSLLGYSQAMVVEYVIGIAKDASSPSDVTRKLEEYGLSPSIEERSFAEELFNKASHKVAGGLNHYEKHEREAVLLARKQKAYSLLDDDDDDDVDCGNERNTGKRYRKKSEPEEKEDEDLARVYEERRAKRRVLDGDSSSESEEERSRDQKEKEQLEQNMRERDAARTRKLTEKKLTRKEEEEIRHQAKALDNNEIETLRKVSRQEYLKKREQKKLEEIRDDIEDEQYLFDGVKLTGVEEEKYRKKKKIYDLAKKYQEDIEVDEYRMPDSYDLDGGIDQEKRFSVALQQYRDPTSEKINRFAEHEAWEDNQIRKATLSFGSKNKKQTTKDYQFVFDDLTHQIDCIKATVMSAENLADHSAESVEKTLALSAWEKLQEERKSLPIYPYRDELLQAVHDHQVIVIVGETGSGKTTQIPQYLHEAGYTKHWKKIACTQPRRVAAMSIAARVSKEMGVKLGHEVGYSIRFEDCTSEKTMIKYMTDGMLLGECFGEPDLASYSVVMVDEAHERTISTDILFGLVKDIARFRPDLKLLISSATLDAVKFSDFFDSAPIFRFPGRRYPVEINYTTAPEADYINATVVSALQIHAQEPPGDVLIFLPGQDEIEIAEEMINIRIKELRTKIAEIIILPIYANLPTELQAKVFEPTPEGSRKVVLATNIAETSLTIDGIRYVIDPGYCKISSYNPRAGMNALQVTPISKASAMQRAGRAGRTSPGKCFRIYTLYNYQTELEDNPIPEIQRTNLANVVLTLKSLGIHDLMNFDFMDPPPIEALLKALELLYALGALNRFGELTKAGRQMAEFPLDPMLSKMVVASDKYKCSEEIITIAAMLSAGNSIFYRRKGEKRVLADNSHMRFYTENMGDHIALLKVYNSWKQENYSTQWCYENYIQVRSMKKARDIRDQLEGLLERVEIKLTTNPNDFEAIKKAITSGFFPHSARLQRSGYKTVKFARTVHIHPSSGLVNALPRWVIYHELVFTTKEYMRQVTELKPEWLIEIAPHYYQHKDVEDA